MCASRGFTATGLTGAALAQTHACARHCGSPHAAGDVAMLLAHNNKCVVQKADKCNMRMLETFIPELTFDHAP
jgi:hypothetical protein